MLNLDSEEKRLLFDTKRRARFCAPLEKSVASIPRALSTKKKTRHLSAHTHDSRSSLLLFLPFCDIYIYIYMYLKLSGSCLKVVCARIYFDLKNLGVLP